MGKILLDYFFPISTTEATAAASTAFLKQALVVVSPKSGQEANVGTIYECTTNAEIEARTDNDDAKQCLLAGMSKVSILLADDLYLSDFLEGFESDFYTVLISSDFDKNDVNATQAQGTITVTSYANLVSGTDDAVTIEGTVFTAQVGAATPGAGTFQAATSNDATAASLAAQINAHAVVSELVVATVLGAVVTVKAVDAGSPGNDIGLSYTDNDTNVGITLAGLSGGNLSGGDGLFLGNYVGVVGLSSDDQSFLATQNAIANRCGFYEDGDNGAENMCFAFGELLSNISAWKNQQYIECPNATDIDTGGECESLFDDKISFVLVDDQYANRLGLFAAGGFAIVAPYIIKNLNIDMQSAALSYISANQPDYTFVQAALLQDELQKVINAYIARGELAAGTALVTLEEDDFVASAAISVPRPRALWRIAGNVTVS